MRTRLALCLTLLSLPALLALECQPTDRVDFTSPMVPVTTASFQISFVLVGDFTGATPQAFLNNQPLVVTGGPTDFIASPSGGPLVNPGPPLQDENLLIVKAPRTSGEFLIAAHTFQYASLVKARVFQIEDLADCPVTGPLAHVRVGDYCLQNSLARFVVQDITKPAVPTDPTPRDLYSVGAFGGNLIDAVLLSDTSNDNFLETTPMLNVETVVNAQTITIVNDGQNGAPAIIRACGPDDLLDFVNPSSQILPVLIGLGLPGIPNCPGPNCIDDNDQPIEACTSYTLAPLDTKVRLDTEVTNTGAVNLNNAVGDWMNAAGELDGWFKPNPGMGEAVTQSTSGGMTWYAETPVPGARFEYGYVPATPPVPAPGPGGYVTVSGVTVILHDIGPLNALTGTGNFPIPAGGSRTYSRYFVVGDGEGNATQEVAHAVLGQSTSTVQGCVTFVGGTPVPNATVTVGLRQTLAPFGITNALAHFITDATGCYSGKVEVPAAGVLYGAIAGKEGALYVGGTATPNPSVSVNANPAGSVRTANFTLPRPGTLEVTVTDALGNPVPSRVTVVGFDPSPEPTVAGTALPGFGSATLGRLNDVGDAVPFGIVAFQHTGADGIANMQIEPGTYHVYATRGTEYSAWSTVGTGAVTITTGAVTALAAQIERVLDTQDFISSDFHVHGIASPDAQVADRTRAIEFAGEGVENLIATDHHVHWDYQPAMAAAGLSAWVTSTVGEEITTFDYGHFNGYPFEVDASVPSGGSTDWAVAEPPGKDFPSQGAYNMGPEEIFELATTQPEAKPYTTVQVNHIDGHFTPLQINTATVPPTDGLDAVERGRLRIDPASPPLGQLFYAFPALELWNGMNRNHQLNEFLGQRIGIWMNLLDQGIRTTAVADTDTHEYRQLRTPGARTWTATTPGNDTPLLYAESEMATSVDEGRAVGGQGIYMQTRLLANDGSGAVADLTKSGSTEVASSNGEVIFEIRVQAPRWAAFDRIEIYSNTGGNVSSVVVNPATPYLYGAAPLQTLLEGDCNPATTGDGDFDVTVVDVAPSVPGAVRWETTVTRAFTGVQEGDWFVALARGSDGSCGPMFPIYPHSLTTAGNTTLANLVDGNVGQAGTMALGFTNALYVGP